MSTPPAATRFSGAMRPLGVDATLHALEDRGREAAERIRLAELALQDARFEADQARARFEAVDPRNRNVVVNLSRSWEERLEVVQEREDQLAEARLRRLRQEPTPEEREAYRSLDAWHHGNVTTQMRKHVLRAVLVEVAATLAPDRIGLLLHWQGGRAATTRKWRCAGAGRGRRGSRRTPPRWRRSENWPG